MIKAANRREKESILLELKQIAQTLQERLNKHQASGWTLTLKVKFSDYQQITRSKTLLTPIRELDEIITQVKALFETIKLGDRNIRLLGISLSVDDYYYPRINIIN
ncbi:DinB/UmuC family translesion DNA polymerase [Mastigocoleus testarum]|uniref:DNA polymerase Y-family little finger domain-containing protein n=1 Tax=Mastigocoleus testarum BC008 TaxID=371196 RepID=A0A0V7ZI51_9CYAN|nr:hypothetical protein [Mastigocoleus testarum]KST64184.1 hypothetical protein BC008_16230 [Mastigocoleus testarum BC008]